MPRPTKCRRVCHFPEVQEFVPTGMEEEKMPVILTIDEYEAIRLIDKEGMSQEQCCEWMQVARTTVQKIYDTARKKLACALVEGRSLKIEGGRFRLCQGRDTACGFDTCYKQQYYRRYGKEKGDTTMRIAVTYDYDSGQIFQHFGHTEYFKVYEIDEEGKIITSIIVDTNGSGHGALAGVLNALSAEVLICGGIGGGAQMALAEAGIKLYGGVTGDADRAVEAYLAGDLDYNPNVRCDHHDHDHHHDHACGSHGCGSGHSCH